MSGTFTPEQPGDEAIDLRGAGAGADRPFVVAVKTPAGHEHRFRVSGEQRVETVTTRAAAFLILIDLRPGV
jgi:hypothetical protein